MNSKYRFFILFLSICFLAFNTLSAAPKADLWDIWQGEGSLKGVDHSPWAEFLDTYLVKKSSGPDLIRYSKVTPEDKKKLKAYIQRLSKTDILKYTKDEQFAFWVNLYNAETVRLILDEYPVSSITKIKSGFFSFGPWDKKLLKVRNVELTLNDIEHRILRPIWKDKRIHYVVNCASISCPSLAREPVPAKNIDAFLDAAAKRYLNDKLGVDQTSKKLVLSSIFDWYRVDFGNDKEFIQHLTKNNPDLDPALLKKQLSDADYEYNWALNEAK